MMTQQSQDQTPPQVRDLENGIFNMVVSFCKHLESQNYMEDSRGARLYVANYLEQIAEGLRDLDNDEENIP